MADANVLLVEGQDDWNVFGHFCRTVFGERIRLQGDKTPDAAVSLLIVDMKGISNLLKYENLKVRLKESDLNKLGIVVDADADVTARWASVRDRLAKFGYALPDVPDPNGTIIKAQDQPVTVGIWVMPNNALPGKLEDFIGFLMPASDTLWIRAEDCVQQIPEPERRFTEPDFIKAHVHTWLAWQAEPGVPMGQAITRRFLDISTLHAQALAGWLTRLYGL